MPKNKRADIRYRLIDEYIQKTASRGGCTFQELLEYINKHLENRYGVDKGISESMLHQDLRFMRSPKEDLGYEAPIKNVNGKYVYTIPGFSILKRSVSELDFERLNSALDLLAPFSFLPHHEDLQQIIKSLRGVAEKGPQDRESDGRFQVEVNKRLRGLEFLPMLYDSMRQEKTLFLQYQPFRDELKRWILHTYLLKEYNNRWYAIGYVEPEGRIFNIALDRIQELESHGNRFVKDDTFDPKTYFQHVIGVSIPEERELARVVLRVHPKQAPYLRTKPLHASQQIVGTEEDGYVLFELHVIPNTELNMKLLSFGRKVEVLEPVSLRDQIKEELEQALQTYQP
jgi:predicted DNA-binding transcriptional regulator YafY